MTARFRDAGFTLMEAIVSLAIFALVLVATQRGFASGSRAIREAQQDSRATAIVQSLLASLGQETALRDGTEAEGQSDGYRWRTRVSAYRDPSGDDNDARRVRLFWAEAQVAWRPAPLLPEKTLTLRTIKSIEVPR